MHVEECIHPRDNCDTGWDLSAIRTTLPYKSSLALVLYLAKCIEKISSDTELQIIKLYGAVM